MSICKGLKIEADGQIPPDEQMLINTKTHDELFK